jgi:hypothetical protein
MKKIAIPTLTTLALLLASCGGNPEASSPPVLRIASPSNPVDAALGAPESSSSDRMMWMGRQHFTVSGDLPSLDISARSYVLPESDVTKSELNSLRDVFSIKDGFVAQDANMGGGYIAGDYNTGDAPVMYVSADAMHYWSYQAPWSNMSSFGCAMPSVEPGDSVSGVEPCAAPTPPENVPSGEEAESMFKQMLKDLGLKSGDFIIEIYADEWNASATGYLKIDGVRSPLMWSASYGADSKLAFASGVLAKITPGADYPRIGTAQGIERLNDQQYGWGGPMMRGGVAYNDMAVAPSDAPSASTTSETNVGEPVSTEPEILEGTIDSAIEDQEMPVTEIEIVAVEEELVSLYGADGSIYLVPGYSFLAAKEAGYTPRYLVSALPDEFIEETSVDLVPSYTYPADAPEASTPEPLDPRNPVTDEPNITQEAADTLLKMSERAATKMAVSNGWEVRVGQRDDEMFMLTKDWIATRVTLTIVADAVTQVDVG